MSVTLGAAVIVGRDRLAQLKNLLPQLTALEQVVIVDSSGQGAIRNYCKKFKNVEWHPIEWRPTSEGHEINEWGFCYARNESFKYLKTTHALWLDTDDNLGLTLNGKERQLKPEGVREGLLKIARENPDVDVWFMDYVYSRDENDNVNVTHVRERFLRLDAEWQWVYPIHEVLVPSRAPKHAVIKDIQVFHHPDRAPGESSVRNIAMLNDWLTQLKSYENPPRHEISRATLLIGDTYWGMEEYAKAAAQLEGFLRDFPDALDLEKWTACIFAAKSYISLGELFKAKEMARLAIDVEPGLTDGYFLLAEAKLLLEEDPQDVLILLETGAAKEQAPPELITNPLEYTYTPFMVTSECKYLLKQYDAALEFALKAQRIRPNDEKAELLRVRAATAVRKRDAQKAALALYQYLQDHDENEKANRLIEFLPYITQGDPEIQEIAIQQRERVAHIWDDEAFKELHGKAFTPSPFEWFEKGYVPGRDLFDYIVRRIKKRGPVVDKILVVNCGDGFHALLLAKMGYKVVGLDINEEAVKEANERAEKLGVADRARFVVGHFERMEPSNTADPFDAERTWFGNFDAVVAEEYLHQCQRPDLALGSLGDCARNGAPIVITVPDGAFDKGDIPLSRQDSSAKTLRAFTQRSFEYLLNSHAGEYHMTEAHFLPYTQSYREEQGWQVGEIVPGGHPSGPKVRIVCGDACQPFSPDNLYHGEGVGGSETAVIEMAYNFARHGAQVVVYGVTEGVWDDVYYRRFEDWSLDQHSDLFISWRLPQMFGAGRPNAEVTVLWTHDLFYMTQIPDAWVANIDKIAVLSNFHKDYIKRVHKNFPDEKLWVTRNGIDPKRYDRKLEKRPHHYFFTSSHERGLEELAELWPAVRKEIPDAVLHVGYGTYTAEEMLKARGDKAGMGKLKEFIAKLKATEGIELHGRLNQWDLATLQLECEAWLYPYQPTWPNGGFLETYCITALEAQAAEALPIVRMNGALPEVVKHCLQWEASWTASELVEALKYVGEAETLSEGLRTNRKWAMSQSWESLAQQWLVELAAFAKSKELVTVQ